VGTAIANTTWTVEYAHVKVPGTVHRRGANLPAVVLKS
jgi:hypothetical protein